MIEQLFEADVYVADDSLHSTIARHTRNPPGNTNPNFNREEVRTTVYFCRRDRFESFGSSRVSVAARSAGAERNVVAIRIRNRLTIQLMKVD
jgi:hypothetical protein